MPQLGLDLGLGLDQADLKRAQPAFLDVGHSATLRRHHHPMPFLAMYHHRHHHHQQHLRTFLLPYFST